MGKQGFKVLDADTHVYEPCEVLEKYLSSRWKEALAGSTTPIARTALRGGMHTYIVGDPKSGQRRLGSREKITRPTAPSADKLAWGTPWGVQWKGPPWPTERVNVDSHARVADMDVEGVDVHVIIPTRGVNGFASADDVGLELAMYEAYHRYMADYCGPHPTRLKSIILASGRDIAGTVKEIERCAKEAWPVALFPITPVGMPIDDPSLDPLWARAVEYALAHLARKPSDYVRGPQFFQSIEMHEGEGTVRSIIELLGPDTLMFGTDYPHTECWFPKSVETILGWHTISDEAKRKLLWGNGVSLYRRCQGG